MRILTVCVGNICRSPLAERLLQQRLDEVRPGFAVVSSAGTLAREGREMDPLAAAELAALGGDPVGFASRRLTPTLLAEADLVLAATKDIRTEAISLAPRAMRRSFTLGELAAIAEAAPLPTGDPMSSEQLVAYAATHRPAGRDGADLVDPIGRSSETHHAVAQQIDAHTRRIASYLLGSAG